MSDQGMSAKPQINSNYTFLCDATSYSFSSDFLFYVTEVCAYSPLRLRHKRRFGRVRKTLCFRVNYLFDQKHGWI